MPAASSDGTRGTTSRIESEATAAETSKGLPPPGELSAVPCGMFVSCAPVACVGLTPNGPLGAGAPAICVASCGGGGGGGSLATGGGGGTSVGIDEKPGMDAVGVGACWVVGGTRFASVATFWFPDGHRMLTRFPAIAWPSTVSGALTPAQTVRSAVCVVRISRMQVAEHDRPWMKSTLVHPVMGWLYASMHARGIEDEVMTWKFDSDIAEAVEAKARSSIRGGLRRLSCLPIVGS